ncbi:F-box only protein 25 [Neosynchiropus ocellatus]
MPFLGKDWRSTGWVWTRTEHGWRRVICYGHELEDNKDLHMKQFCCANRENVFVDNVCQLATTKRKKDFSNHKTRSQFVFTDKWVCVQKGSTKERHGYCTLGEALNRLDFSSAIEDLSRFNYVAKILMLIARCELTSLSGAAQKNYFNILEKIVHKAFDDHYNPRIVREVLRQLITSMQDLTVQVGRCALVGNTNTWMCRQQTVLKWLQQLSNLQIPKEVHVGISLCQLPLHTQVKILNKLSDVRDVVNLGRVSPTLHMLSESTGVWKKLCHFHFSGREVCGNLVLTQSDKVDWKLMYLTLRRYYPIKEQYSDTLYYCNHCRVVFWQDHDLAILFKDSGHPCTITPGDRMVPISPQRFIDLFKF